MPVLGLSGHLLHQAVVLHLHHRGPIGTAFDGVLNDRLPLELLGPRLLRIIDHSHRGMVHNAMRLVALLRFRVGRDREGAGEKPSAECQGHDKRRKNKTT